MVLDRIDLASQGLARSAHDRQDSLDWSPFLCQKESRRNAPSQYINTISKSLCLCFQSLRSCFLYHLLFPVRFPILPFLGRCIPQFFQYALAYLPGRCNSWMVIMFWYSRSESPSSQSYRSTDIRRSSSTVGLPVIQECSRRLP